MVDVEKLQTDRYKFLRYVYELTGGSERKSLQIQDAGRELGFDKDTTELITNYLVNERLIKRVAMGGLIGITHFGIKEIEESISKPTQPTEHLPATTNTLSCTSSVGFTKPSGGAVSKEVFIILDHRDPFYKKLVGEINNCCDVGAYNAVLILSRKLIENLLIDVLRKKYGDRTKEGVETYYWIEKWKHHDFSVLLEKLEERKNDFKVDSDTIEQFFELVKLFRKGANKTAHSIVDLIEKKDELDAYDIQTLVDLLKRLYDNTSPALLSTTSNITVTSKTTKVPPIKEIHIGTTTEAGKGGRKVTIEEVAKYLTYLKDEDKNVQREGLKRILDMSYKRDVSLPQVLDALEDLLKNYIDADFRVVTPDIAIDKEIHTLTLETILIMMRTAERSRKEDVKKTIADRYYLHMINIIKDEKKTGVSSKAVEILVEINDERIAEPLTIFIISGSEEVYNSIKYTLYLMARHIHNDVKDKLMNELTDKLRGQPKNVIDRINECLEKLRHC